LVKIIIIKNHWSLETGISISIIEVSYKILTPTGTPSDQSDALFVWLISHQLAVLFSQNKPASSTFLSEQTNTSHQPPAQRTGCEIAMPHRKPECSKIAMASSEAHEARQ
jgi:hypothetical protein